MKKLSDSELETELRLFKEAQKERNGIVFHKDLKSLMISGAVKESAGPRKKGIIVNRSSSTNQLHQPIKNRAKVSLCHRDQCDSMQAKIDHKHNSKRIHTQISHTISFNPKKSKQIPKEPEIPIQTIKQYLKSRAPKIPSEINQNINVSANMRKIVVCWLIQLSHALRFKPETLFHTIFLFDRMLEMKTNEFDVNASINPEQIDISIENLQLLAVACVLISSKYEQITPPPLRKFLEFTQHYYSKKKLIDMESKILMETNFNLTYPTRFTFITSYLDTYHCYSLEKQNRLTHMCHYLATISLLELWEDTTEDELGEAIFFLGKKVLGCQNPPNNQFRKKQGKKLYSCAWKLKEVWSHNYGGIVSYIFDSDKYSFVGGVYIKES